MNIALFSRVLQVIVTPDVALSTGTLRLIHECEQFVRQLDHLSHMRLSHDCCRRLGLIAFDGSLTGKLLHDCPRTSHRC